MRVHLWISGVVQDIGYRSFVRERAFELGIKGWVKNLPDGRVEAVFEGSPQAVEKMVFFCKEGPLGSKVSNIDEKKEQEERVRGFEIRY